MKSLAERPRISLKLNL